MICPSSNAISVPCVNRVAVARPFAWLRLGLTDLAEVWPISLAYGSGFALLGYFLVYAGWTEPYIALTLTSGFLLVAPFMAVVFYELSARREHGRKASSGLKPFQMLADNAASIGMFGLLLGFMLSAWERITAILIGMYLGSHGVPEASLRWLFSSANTEFLVLYTVIGAIFALAVFALSAVSLPMLMDRQVDIVTAMVTSLWVVRENSLALLLWAALIVSLTAIGMATAFIGLAFLFPLLGHASWHAYRELVTR
jgi:uncharacterized membrane protein